MATYDPDIATSLQGLAKLAVGDISLLPDIGLPTPWSLASSAAKDGVQGFLAAGELYDETIQIALVMGAPWTDFLNEYAEANQFLVQVPVDDEIVSGTAGKARAAAGHAAGVEPADDSVTYDAGVQKLYLKLRSHLWDAVAEAAQLVESTEATDLLICGHGIGASLAELAAYDFRPDKPDITIRFKQIRLYTFSAPMLANAGFQEQFETRIVDAWRVSAGTSSLIDFFPIQPSGDFVGLGTAQQLAASLPEFDSPWWERSGSFYTDVLTGGSTSANPVGGESSTADGYSADMAFTIAQLCAAAALRSQHPDLDPAPSSWRLTDPLPGDNPWLCVFARDDPKAFAAIFRGGTTCEETLGILADGWPFTMDWVDFPGSMHAGAYKLYTSLRDDVRSLLAGLDWTEGAVLYLGGHSLGAIMASVAAVDLEYNPIDGAPPASIYALGCTTTAGPGLESYVPELPARLFLVNRPQDAIADVSWNLTLSELGTSITLNGNCSFDEQTYHAINTYIALLDPQS